jgi:HPt (histidine-containing phosphotransfer) domain-containing protein
MERSTDVSPPAPSSSSEAKASTTVPPAGTAADLAASLKQASERQTRFLRRLIPLFMMECPQLLNTMRQAIDARDAGKLNYAAHTLKGASSFIADGAIIEVARQLETMGQCGILDGAGATLAVLEKALAELLPVLAGFVKPPETGSSTR